MKRSTFAFRFAEFIPKQLDEGVLYVSMTYATASHRCFCGCGMKVVTPLSPTDWRLVFNGDAVSLEPSIGNWSYPCRSHYILRNNRILWSGPMSPTEINSIRDRDRLAKQHYYRRGRLARRPECSARTGRRHLPMRTKRVGQRDRVGPPCSGTKV